MKIASAQTIPVDGNIEANLAAHYRLAEKASEHGVRFLLFPEMSLTGYQQEAAEKLCFTEDDARLGKLKERAAAGNIVIAAGAPVKIGSKLHIGLFILRPDGRTAIYTKQFLHAGEETFFVPSFDHNPTIELDGERIAPAVCADITNPRHPENARRAAATVYAASIFYTPNGIIECYEQLGRYAEAHSMNILMANFAGASYKFEAAGRSAFWTKKGERIGALGEGETGLLVVETEENKYAARVLPISPETVKLNTSARR